MKAGISRHAILILIALAGSVPGAVLTAQTLPQVSENVVVSAGLAPEEEPSVPASATVITRPQIEKSGQTSLLELLRQVPGLDVVQSGGSGTVASVFLRGATSNQTLILVDGVRVNDPTYGGFDLSALPTMDIERIEIVRGPFSALYGSDAVGGVISIFTRPPSRGFHARATAAAGNRAYHEETLFAEGGAGTLAGSVAARDVHDGGDPQEVGGVRVDNSAWRDRTGSARLQWSPSETFDAGLSVERTFARTGIPTDGAVATPDNFTDFAQTLWTLPVRWAPGEDNTLTGSLSDTELSPDFQGGEGRFPYSSRTRARTRGARALDMWNLGNQTLSASASYEASDVTLDDSYGTELGGRAVHTWGFAAEDRLALAGGRLTAVAGVRYDRHSAFGSTTNPRVSLAWNLDARDAVRASFGTAFRAPSIGELYYPGFGNPDLRPERSRSFEAGFARRAGSLEADVSLFRNDVRDLIQPDFTTFVNTNVGRARMEGVEAAVSAPVVAGFLVRAAYTYLRARDESTGLPLVRRPRHRASLDASWDRGPWSVSGRVIFTGRRRDVEAATYAPVEDPSYTRFDLYARFALGAISPFVRVENLTDRRYAEVNGYPAPGRRIAAGFVASF